MNEKEAERREEIFSYLCFVVGVGQKNDQLENANSFFFSSRTTDIGGRCIVTDQERERERERDGENRRKGSKTFYLVNAPSDGIFRVDFRIAHRFTRKRVRIS